MEERLPNEGASAPERQLETGKTILERIRSRTNGNTGYFENWDDEDLFSAIYLTPRTAAVPEIILAEPLNDVRAMFAQVFGGVREELAVRLGWEESVWVYVDASLTASRPHSG